MIITIARWYVEAGCNLPISHELEDRLEDEIGSLVQPSASFLQRYGQDWTVTIHLTPKMGIIENQVTGPHVYKKGKELTYTIHMPFDVILRADNGPHYSIYLLLQGVRSVLAQCEIDTVKLDGKVNQIIGEICANPELFRGDYGDEPWPTLANYKPPPPPAPKDPTLPAFKRIYKRINGVLHYESVFAHEGIAHHHAGKVGTKGKTKELAYAGTPKKAVETFLGVAIAKGFTAPEKEYEIEIQYNIDDMGTPEDFDKLDALENHLHNLLGTLGLGVCNENSIGGGTMEVSCYVVDADIAMKCIRKSLHGTRFADYALIHIVESDEEDDVET